MSYEPSETAKPKAYSYVRFSTPEQEKGDSFRRQTVQAQEYAFRKGLELDETLRLHDRGVSSFRGDNIATGRLGYFLEAVKSGEVAPGSYLLVESLDRISRDNTFQAQTILSSIIMEGITVVTLIDEREYSLEVVQSDPTALIYAILMFMRANEESSTKSRRLKEAWRNKRAHLESRPMTSRVPAWLRLDLEKREVFLIPERAAIVERIFRETLAGMGQHQIAQRLNGEGVKPWGRAAYWQRSYIAKLLSSEAVIGAFTAFETDHAGGKKIRTPVARVEGYFPAAVPMELWSDLQASRNGKNPRVRGRHSASPVTNMLAGMAACPVCGGTMTRTHKGSRSRPSYVCARAKSRAGCVYRSVRVDVVEEAIAALLPERLRDAPAGERNPQLDQDIMNLDGRAEESLAKIEALLDAIERGGDSTGLVRRLREIEGVYESTRAEIRELEKRRASIAGATVHARIEKLLSVLEPEEGAPVPALVNLALQTVFRRVIVDHRLGELVFEWLHGGEFALVYRSGFEVIQA